MSTPTMRVRQVFSDDLSDIPVFLTDDPKLTTLDVEVVDDDDQADARVKVVSNPRDAAEIVRIVRNGGNFTGLGYLLLDGAGDYASTSDAPSLDILGNIDIAAALALDDWTPAAINTVVAKADAYKFTVESDGKLNLAVENVANQVSTVAPSVTDGAVLLIRATRVRSTGTYRYYTKASATGDILAQVKTPLAEWAQLGSDVSGSTSAFASNAEPLRVGSKGGIDEFVDGKVLAVVVREGIDGTVVADPDFSAQLPGTTEFTDAQGNVWHLNGNAQIVANP